ncbi:urea ABC transporter permease subunit UrtC [Thioalkalivibrio sp.]|uniref:urea ABC transporter permease subunit UrtC n=1 Tax=Thioalkalivibrio sp. TaxID=2093813 RepID=UPI0012D52989|nr:urea ABC transporter permease subunit UrtC [Thioalkalivibrio sp.]TVP81657.1 MAG: urea ABC transporter permease subunit UrtC [Thioalkalivibrio sp.]
MLTRRLFLSDWGGMTVLVLLLAMAVAVPYANLVLPPESPWHLSTYWVALIGKFLTFALLALAIDLIWGYAGILSLGHGAFFGLGGYAMGMYLTRQIGDRGVYGNPELPDFMVFLSYESLPWYWWGFDMFWFAMLMVVLVPGLLALVFGWLAFRSRVTGVYFAIITQALVFALMLAFFRNEMGFGGNNGLTDFKDILGFPVQARETRVALFVVSALVLILAYVASRFIVTSRFGRVLIAVRDAESRARFSGYRVEHYKLWLFVFSAMLAGIAGALYVPQVGIINPGEFAPLRSIEAVLWVAVGGRGSLFGAIIGAFAVNGAKTWFTTAYPMVWLFALGALFVLVTVFLPRGLVGIFRRRRREGGA